MLIIILSLTACQSAYYATMEKIGVHKRDIMVDRVESASQAQQEARDQFTSALDALQNVTKFKGGQLEEIYNEINDEYEQSNAAVENVSSRINAVKDVSDALFEEWQDELSLYSNSKLRKESEKKLKATQYRYGQMLKAMEKAQSQMQPVLNTLRDNTLYLKHNLNAAAIDALKSEFSDLKLHINIAIKNMQNAINESNRFLETLKK